jgi:hypothetical protein
MVGTGLGVGDDPGPAGTVDTVVPPPEHAAIAAAPINAHAESTETDETLTMDPMPSRRPS